MSAHSPRLEGLDLSPVQPMRRPSLSSDIASNSSRSNPVSTTVPRANPSPAYVAGSEASDLLSAELGRRVDVSASALTLLNEFLDHVLYSIICTSRSVSLGQLKAAVPVVLKPRLGKAALKVAEEELKDYIEDDEAEDWHSSKNNLHPKFAFDTDLVWKLARLRCMVYARMGDLEEEDEEEWLDKEHLLDQAAAAPSAARLSMVVTPGAAIFLTSIVEYLGEQALYYAAQYAQKRHDTARNTDEITKSNSEFKAKDSDIFLEGKDMNHVGRDSPLSRLWRSWRRNTRSPADTISEPISPLDTFSSVVGSMHSQTTVSTGRRSISPLLEHRRMSNPALLTPSRIPLPISENDVEEINGYGFATNGVGTTGGSRRPTSMPTIPGEFPEDFMEDVYTPMREAPIYQERSPLRPSVDRTRSNSLPTGSPSYVINTGRPLKQAITTEEVAGEPRPAQSETASSNRLAETPSPEQVEINTGIKTSVLSAVGVHHVNERKKPQPPSEDNSDRRPKSPPKSPNQPLTSASIKGPGDFDMMYVPEGRISSEAGSNRPTTAVTSQAAPQRTDSYQEIAAKQLKEHQNYSRQLHEMTTPSIYSNHEHSPRFPRNARSTSTAEERLPKLEKASNDAPRAIATPEPSGATSSHTVTPGPGRTTSAYDSTPEAGKAASSYAPTPEPGQYYDKNGNYIYGSVSVEPIPSWQRQPDSPVSQMSGKSSAKRYPHENEPVPELPRTLPPQKTFAEKSQPAHSRGHSKSSSSSSQLLGFTRDTSGKPHSVYQQRASGGMTEEVRRAHSSTPDGRNDRPDTVYSTTSSKRQHLRIRADSDNNVVRPASNEFTAQRSLEVLINSDETLHYTLTPATAEFREEDLNPPAQKRTQTQDLADFFRNTAPPGKENTALPSTRSRKASLNASRAPQVLPITRGPIPSSKDAPQQLPKQKTRNPMGEPRDAKVDRMSGVRDLADYARSTGPSNENQLPKALGGHILIPDTNRPIEMAAPTSPVGSAAKSQTRPHNRLRFQARDARPSRHAESTDLIEFLREGPPSESQSGNQLGVQAASYRTTTNSDDYSTIRSSQPKGSSDTNGIHSVADSQSPLLNQDNRAGLAPPASFTQRTPQVDTNGNVPTKTQTRVKDPYRIEDSDDEWMEDQAPRQPTNEETLIDFLRNTGPAASSASQPVLATPPQNTNSSKLDRRPSADRLKDLVRANKNSTTSGNPVKQTQAQTRARAESPHLTQAGSKFDSYRPTQVTHASHVDRNRNKSKTRNGKPVQNGDVPLKKGYGETADLAEYLRNTGPTPAQEGWTQPLVDRQVNGVKGDSGGGLRKFFSMRGRK